MLGHFNYWIYIILMMIGFYAMVSKNNMIKKLIGMSIFQTAIMLFYVSIGYKKGASIPILQNSNHDGSHAVDGAGSELAHQAASHAADAANHLPEDAYVNPLPHVLMLTAIVVGVATLGVAMAVLQKVYHQYGSIEEDEVLARVKSL